MAVQADAASPLAHAAPHWRYLGVGGVPDIFDYGVLPRLGQEAGVSFMIQRVRGAGEGGDSTYALHLEWDWAPGTAAESFHTIDEVRTVHATDYRPTCVYVDQLPNMLVAGVDRLGNVLVESWEIGNASKRELRDSAGQIVERLLIPSGVLARTRLFYDASGSIEPVNGMGARFVRDGASWCPVRCGITGDLMVLELSPAQSSVAHRLFGPSDIEPALPNDADASRSEFYLRRYWDPSLLFVGIERRENDPNVGDVSYLLIPHPREEETQRVPFLRVVDVGDDFVIDRAIPGS